MSTSVLVPLDGSDKDARALIAAAAMVDLIGGNVRLIRVFEPPTSSMTERALTMGGQDLLQKRLVETSRSLSDSAERLGKATGKEVIAEIAEGFDVADVLLRRAASEDIAAVVMSTRAASPPDRAFYGSVADRIMRESVRPVLLVPPGADVSRSDRIRLKRVLMPLDGSRPSLAASECLFELDRDRTLEHILLEVVPESKVASGALIDLADRLRENGRAVQVRVVADLDPAGAINRTALDEQVDFIAMSPRGLSGLQRLVQGSVTEGVLRSSRIPLFLLAGG